MAAPLAFDATGGLRHRATQSRRWGHIASQGWQPPNHAPLKRALGLLIFRESGRALSWHGSLYRQRIGPACQLQRYRHLLRELQALRPKLPSSLAKVVSDSLA